MTGDVDLRHHGDAEVGGGLVDFAVNVRTGMPPEWLAARIRASIGDLAAYPDPRPARRAVARRHGRSAEEVLLTAGAAEAFVLLARVLAPRRAVVVHPQFTEPEAALRAAGHEVERVVLGKDFTLDAVPPSGVPDDADLVVIGNPTNPTSVLHPADVVTALARPGRTVVVDEAFMDCVPGEPETLATRLPPGIVVIRSLTKTWGLAGLRAGYILADPHLIGRLAEAQPLWAVSTPALVAIEACSAPEAVAEAEAWAVQLAAERDRLAAELSARGLYVVPEARASFLCLCVPDALGLRALLRQRGYAVRRGDTFPGLGPDWLRIAVRDRPSNDRLLEVLGELGI
ncbi:Rv2231c family pyridoxal phosphate-dependent protein CobC [Actinomadura madurae]|uniref:Rv2231c family pyridoxal phosphate-dependent protein CobC n=1 Tax=Actinomadura madurae TaxID=1993 RepID=UPI002027031B|nr:Rv2231c family pyridoxal phosphate-dependent protein CobC [Actinomadura madurae]URM95253.1 Rv2231c family pyridoxal phosphate-dependent protein CobC [Actinomadura madurae]URN05960.1 Rv2231c family pyridoxal phosphate-dependent protein CobC [Actinomadura madurae]